MARSIQRAISLPSGGDHIAKVASLSSIPKFLNRREFFFFLSLNKIEVISNFLLTMLILSMLIIFLLMMMRLLLLLLISSIDYAKFCEDSSSKGAFFSLACRKVETTASVGWTTPSSVCTVKRLNKSC